MCSAVHIWHQEATLHIGMYKDSVCNSFINDWLLMKKCHFYARIAPSIIANEILRNYQISKEKNSREKEEQTNEGGGIKSQVCDS